MAYSPQATRVFTEGVRRAFETREDLDRLLGLIDLPDGRGQLSVGAITSPNQNMFEIAADVVRWACDHDRIGELFDHAIREKPDNPWLRQAHRFAHDPDRIENRPFGRIVPLLSWLLGVAAFVIGLLLVKIHFVNLLDLRLLLFWISVALGTGYAVWRLADRFRRGGDRSGLSWAWRQLIAHSRLETRDWSWFGASAGAAGMLLVAVPLSPSPLAISFSPAGMPFEAWQQAGFRLVDQPLPSIGEVAEGQGPETIGIDDAAAFERSYYRVDMFVAPFNRPGPIALELALESDAAGGVVAATLQRLALAGRITSALDPGGRFIGDGETAQEGGHLRELEAYIVLPFDDFKGRSSIVLTCSRRRETRADERKVQLHARLWNLADNTILYEATPRPVFADDWR